MGYRVWAAAGFGDLLRYTCKIARQVSQLLDNTVQTFGVLKDNLDMN